MDNSIECDKMIVIVDNKDSRIKYLIEELSKEYQLEIIDDSIKSIRSGGILFIPIQGIDDRGFIKKTEYKIDDIVDNINPRMLLVPKISDYYKKFGIECVEYLTLDIEIINSIYTVEGALCLISSNTTKSLSDMEVLLTGYGKLGQTLADYLKLFGSNVTIYSNCEKELLTAKIRGFKTIRSLGYIDTMNYDTIINTVPVNIFSLEVLKRTPQTLYLELASYPYGVDISKAKNFIKTYLGAGLPGKFTPESAGKLIGRKILGILND
ncbi:hypothetical protein RI065_08785 [Mycoplasmatota bacterium zrk1]